MRTMVLLLATYCWITVSAIYFNSWFYCLYYRPQTKFVKVMFLQVSVILSRGGMHGCSRGACMVAPEGVRGCSGGVCVVLFGGHGFIWGGMHGFIWGVCVVLFGGHAWFYWGACVVLFGGHVWFYSGGMRGFFTFFGYNEIWSMSGQYASYWNAFLFVRFLTTSNVSNIYVIYVQLM